MTNQGFPPPPPLPGPDSGTGPFPGGPPGSGIPPPGPEPKRNLVPWLAAAAAVIVAIVVVAVVLSTSDKPGPVTPTLGGGPTGGTTQPAGGIPAGFQLHRQDADGFAVAVPSDWRVSSPTNEFVKFLAGDRGPSSVAEGFSANINVVRQDVPAGTTLDEYVTLNVDQLQAGQAGFSIVSQIDRTGEALPAGPAERLHYQAESTNGTQTVRVVQTQHYILNGSVAFVITVTATPNQEAGFDPIFDQIMQTFQFV